MIVKLILALWQLDIHWNKTFWKFQIENNDKNIVEDNDFNNGACNNKDTNGQVFHLHDLWL